VTTFELSGIVEYAVANDTEAVLIDWSREKLRGKAHSKLKLDLTS
jgi:hypothetical protein